ncbi:MAG: SMP-30/gluconolactonase/LRE family protein [Planctomycetaceae bacterium]|jgi:sugar lactone lactonase YvrE|nr:SMP-30/gluconolactonase/LRE family protein [Planctomycetaceae bacterium]
MRQILKQLPIFSLFVLAVFSLTVLPFAADLPLKPVKAIELPDGQLHPDGMTVNPRTKDIILAVPLVGDKGHACLYRIDENDHAEKYFEIPAHPETGRSTPLGISFGPDGHLYVADSQCLGGDPNHKSRLLRVYHNKQGKPIRCEVLVTGICQANGLEIFGSKIYVAETQITPAITEMPMTSGVFCFDINEFNGVLNAGKRRGFHKPIEVAKYGKDPHFIFSFQTTDADRKGEWKVGANGIGLSPTGETLYVANFGDKKIIKVDLGRKGKKILSSSDINDGNGPNESVDGLKVCPKGYIFFADYVGNAVCVMNPANGKTVVLAKNALNPGEADKKAGALDRCSEVCLRGSKLYVSNIDLTDTSKPHTVSVFDIQGINFDELLK